MRRVSVSPTCQARYIPTWSCASILHVRCRQLDASDYISEHRHGSHVSSWGYPNAGGPRSVVVTASISTPTPVSTLRLVMLPVIKPVRIRWHRMLAISHEPDNETGTDDRANDDTCNRTVTDLLCRWSRKWRTAFV